MIEMLRVTPLHPLFAPLPALLSIPVDFLQIAPGLLQVAQKQVVIAQVNLRVPNELGVTNLVCSLGPFAIVPDGRPQVVQLPIHPSQGIQDSTPEDLIAQAVTQRQGVLQRRQCRRILPLATMDEAPVPEAQ